MTESHNPRSRSYDERAERPGLSAMAVTGLIIAIVALVLCLIPIVNNGAAFLAIASLIFAIIGIVGTRRGRKRGRGLAITGAILSVLAFVGVLGSQAFYGSVIDTVAASASADLDKVTGDATDELLGKEVTADLGTFSATQDQYGLTTTELPVHVANLVGEAHSYMIQIEAVDAGGNRIADDTLMANNLGAGQAQDFKTFQFVDSTKVDMLKEAQFRVIEVSQL